MDGHHLILGELVDYITGETIADTHDERYRQKLAHLLVAGKGYPKEAIKPRCGLLVSAGNKKAIIKVDFQITLSGKICMIIKYGPGSLVTRYRPALAASRLIAPYQVPVVVVTNGETAEILDGSTGTVLSHGLDAIPSRPDLVQQVAQKRFDLISATRAEMESRILYAFEVDGCCPCDDSVCKL